MDRYTKGVLTVIAVALSVIAAQNAVGPTNAQSRDSVQRVVICDVDGAKCAKTFGSDSQFEKFQGSLAVGGNVQISR